MATIIRKDSQRELKSGISVQPVAFSFADMRGQANSYLDVVREEAAKIVQNAHTDAAQIRTQAEVAGRKAAEAAVERILDEKIARRMDTLLPALEQLVAQVNDAKGELLEHWHRAVVRVATAIAERIIRRELKQEPQITLEFVQEALRLATGSAEITVHLNDSDFENLGAQVQRLAESLRQLSPSEIVADRNVTPGGCLVETRFGEIDLQVESQLRRVEEELN
jgi:flagellar assembly protein FliH